MRKFMLMLLFAGSSFAQQLPVVTAIHAAGVPRAGREPAVIGGKELTVTIELSGPAVCNWGCGQTVNGRPAGGLLIKISSSNPAVVQPPRGAGVIVPVGETSHSYPLLTGAVGADTRVTVSAEREGSPAKSTIVMVEPPSLTGFSIDQQSVTSGATAHGTLTFSGPPSSAGSIVVKLSANPASIVQVPATVSPQTNTTAATFDIKTLGVTSSSQVTITATDGDKTQTATLKVQPAALTSYDDKGLHLNGPAGPGGAVIALKSGDPNRVQVPATVTVPGGAADVGVDYVKVMDYSQHTVNVSATYNGATKNYGVYVWPLIKADMAIRDVSLRDRFGNAITHPTDAQTYKMCVTIEFLNAAEKVYYQYPKTIVMNVSYLTPTGTGTSAGHESDVTITNPITQSGGTTYYNGAQMDSKNVWINPVCIDMPGLSQPGAYTDVKLMLDPHNAVDETNEGNNGRNLRITRQ